MSNGRPISLGYAAALIIQPMINSMHDGSGPETTAELSESLARSEGKRGALRGAEWVSHERWPDRQRG